MKTIKETIYEYVQKLVMTDSTYREGITTKDIADHFELQRSNVSTVLNDLVKEKRLEKTTTRPVHYFLPEKKEQKVNDIGNNVFIGMNGSLANSIHVAKAAIYYPGRKLNILISAKPGCGTTYFAHCMYLFGISAGIFKENIPFYKINCRHFKNNMSELLDILFSPTDMQKSLFSLARGGMLFIDNADLLDSIEKTRLSDFLENGMLYSYDRKETLDCSDTFVMLSCNPGAISEFSSRISMIVRLPELSERPLSEKMELITYFFTAEANNAKRNIEVKREVLERLLMSEFEYNVKGLSMAIKRACATACVRTMDDPDSNVDVTVYDFDEGVQKSSVRLRNYTSEINDLLGSHTMFIFDCHKEYHSVVDDGTHDFYDYIRTQYSKLVKQGVNEKTIQNIINNHVNALFRKYNYYCSYNDKYDIEQLSKIVDEKIIHMVSATMDMYQRETKKQTRSQVFYGLCLHMNSLLKQRSVFSGPHIESEKINRIVEEYAQEYSVSAQLALAFEEEFGIELPMEEIIIITMFFINDEKNEQGHPVLLYIFHGSATASSLAELTNTLMHSKNTYAYDLSLDKSTETAEKEIQKLIEKIDQGNGVIVIYDMGSIRTMLDTISTRTDTAIRYICMPVTLLGLDIARKCTQEEDIDYLYHSTIREMKALMNIKNNHREIIITLCYTGEGGAAQLKQYIDQYSSLGIKTVPLAISNRDELIQKVMELQKLYHIHCFVGTYDPKLLGIPFVSMAEIFENRPEDLDRLLVFETVQASEIDYTAVYEFLEKHFHFISVDDLKESLPPVIDELSIVYSMNSDTKIGLFMHIASLLENIKSGTVPSVKDDVREILDTCSDEIRTVSNIMKTLEKKFDVIIDDYQIALIIRMIRKL